MRSKDKAGRSSTIPALQNDYAIKRSTPTFVNVFILCSAWDIISDHLKAKLRALSLLFYPLKMILLSICYHDLHPLTVKKDGSSFMVKKRPSRTRRSFDDSSIGEV